MADKQDNFPFICLFQQGTSMNLSFKEGQKAYIIHQCDMVVNFNGQNPKTFPPFY